MMYYYNNSFLFPFHFIFMILFWVIVIYAIVWLVRRFTLTDGKEDRAMNVLRDRYAKGEITKEQFESMKKDLQ